MMLMKKATYWEAVKAVSLAYFLLFSVSLKNRMSMGETKSQKEVCNLLLESLPQLSINIFAG